MALRLNIAVDGSPMKFRPSRSKAFMTVLPSIRQSKEPGCVARYVAQGRTAVVYATPVGCRQMRCRIPVQRPGQLLDTGRISRSSSLI